jgi:hypothetical protein
MSGLLLPPDVKEIPNPFVVVCEGMGDARFIEALMKHKGITNCNVGCPSEAGGSGCGREAIPSYLKALATARQRLNQVLRGISIIADADSDPNASFDFMVRALASAGFPVPNRPFSVEGEQLRIAVFLIPEEGRTGTLEHVLLDAAFSNSPEMEGCVEDFARCTGVIESAPSNKQAKMKLSALVAACCKDNPWASPALMWSDRGNPVPIASERFNHISSFLAEFVR